MHRRVVTYQEHSFYCRTRRTCGGRHRGLCAWGRECNCPPPTVIADSGALAPGVDSDGRLSEGRYDGDGARGSVDGD